MCENRAQIRKTIEHSLASINRFLDYQRADEVQTANAWANVRTVRIALLVIGTLALALGVIGIVVPHLVRLMVGVDHRLVLPASALFGAAFLVACDLVARTAMAPVEIPVGIVTAIIGGPFFLWLLVRKS